MDNLPPDSGHADGADPFAPENIGVVQFIMQARIYDVLMALLMESNEEAAANLLEIHSQGALMGTAPFFTGAFITDLANQDEK